jgi:Arc/MetJ-type ribon-helix-helix transcriptional regulator
MKITLPPELASFVDKKLAGGRYKQASDVLIEALRQFQQTDRVATSTICGLAGADIEAEIFVVLMEAVKSANEDLKAIMSHVKAINAAKDQLRKIINKVNNDVAANISCAGKPAGLDFSTGMGSEEAYHQAPIPVPASGSVGGVRVVPTDLHNGSITNVAELKAIWDDLNGKLDSMGDMSAIESLQLQMVMDRRSKLITTLSNIMKKISSTSDTIIQNIK